MDSLRNRLAKLLGQNVPVYDWHTDSIPLLYHQHITTQTNVPHLKIKAHVNVVEVPKASESTTVDTRPTTITKRQPKRSATTPQKCEDIKRPIMNAEVSNPA